MREDEKKRLWDICISETTWIQSGNYLKVFFGNSRPVLSIPFFVAITRVLEFRAVLANLWIIIIIRDNQQLRMKGCCWTYLEVEQDGEKGSQSFQK